jgi:Protein of unknown function (DUF2971)
MALNNHLRERWASAGYSTRMGSAAVLPPPSKGFRRLYHLTNADHAISNIVFNRLKVARFSELNDPFELFALKFSDKRRRKLVRAHKDKLDQEKGLLCFGADWTDPVLWSHYAAKHRGICLGFDVKEGLAKQVTYEEKRLADKVGSDDTTIDTKLAELLLYTKFESWRYEKEWRVLVVLADMTEEGSQYYFPLSKQVQLTEVVLGSLCSLQVDAVRGLVLRYHPDAVTFKARLAAKSFNVVPSEKTVLPYP